MAAQEYDLTVEQGKYTRKVIRWAQAAFGYAAITAITQQAPVRITAAGHGLKTGWPSAVVSVKGMTEINAELDSATQLPLDSEYRPVVVVDGNTVEFNAVNSTDFSAYTSGGYLQFHLPVDLTGYTARMQVRDKSSGAVLLSLTTENEGIEIDAVENTITLVFTEADTVGDTWKRGLYELEVVDASSRPFGVVRGELLLVREVTYG